MIFDGKKFAEEIISKLPKKKAKLAIFLDPSNVSGAKYVEKKVEVGKRLGVEIVMNKIDGDEDGIMVQLPHPKASELISQIPPEKDVDGLREDSPFRSATVMAVLAVLGEAKRTRRDLVRLVIVGSRGFVGRKLCHEFRTANYGLVGMDKEDFDPEKIKMADVVISATGRVGLIKPDMVKDGVVAIDIGYPKGDFDPEVAKKASFFTPVPGGVGPVTVAMLFANLLN